MLAEIKDAIATYGKNHGMTWAKEVYIGGGDFFVEYWKNADGSGPPILTVPIEGIKKEVLG